MASEDEEERGDTSIEANSETAMEEEEYYTSDDSETSIFKRRKSNDEEKALESVVDRISALPDSLLLHILSSLPTKSVFRTSILSKRWQYLPTFIPILDFNELDNWHMNIKKTFGDLDCFVSSINHTLILCQSPKLEKFRVRMKFLEAFDDDVDVWVRFAMRKNVEELDLNFSNSFYCGCYVDEDDEDEVDKNTGLIVFARSYILPRTMLCSSSLVTLKLTRCEIEHCELINWKSLKVLSLSEMELNNDMIRDILLGSPSLELLELRECGNYDFVEINSERCRKLVINGCSFAVGRKTLKIVAPNIQSLDLSGRWSVHKFSLTNSSSLVDAKLNFSLLGGSGNYYGPHREYPNILGELLEKLRLVKDLSVGNWCLQVEGFGHLDCPLRISFDEKVISVMDKKAMPSQSSNRTCLKIETQLSKWCLPGITKLLALTPLLETLVINMTSDELFLSEFELEEVFLQNSDFYDENYWPSHKSFFMPALLNLKTVKIVNFMASSREIYLILFLLKNAMQLQKMIIQAAKAQDLYVISAEEFLEIVQILVSCPRCSPDAVLSFCLRKNAQVL